jgi:hypothetical protein
VPRYRLEAMERRNLLFPLFQSLSAFCLNTISTELSRLIWYKMLPIITEMKNGAKMAPAVRMGGRNGIA